MVLESPNKKEIGFEFDEDIKPHKGPADWKKVMEHLAPFTNELFQKIEKVDDSEWNDLYNATRKSTSDFLLRVTEYPEDLKNLGQVLFPSMRFFENAMPARLMWRPSKYANNPKVSLPDPMRRPLIGAGALLSVMTSKHNNAPIDTNEYRDTSLDLSSAVDVMNDNAQTILDVASLVGRFAKTPTEFTTLFQRLLQTCPNDEITVGEKIVKLNPWSYSYLELFALAPFGFWASVRYRQPKTYEDRAIVRPDDPERLIDPEFVYALTRAKVAQGEEPHARHGGCPALYPRTRELDLVNRLGRIFLRAEEEFLKHEPPQVKTAR